MIVLAAATTSCAHAVDPAAIPRGDAIKGTHVLDHKALLGNVNDPEWFEANIPFVEVPDPQIQQVYYYRWQTYKEHLVYTGPIYGWMSSEFLQPVSYGAPYGGVVAAAGHQITEGRWLRDQQYVKDDIDYWLGGPGQFPKPQNDGVNLDATDWAHEYSFWAASAVWQTYLATGDRNFAVAHEQALIKQYRGWDNHFNTELGLYWQVPVWDATEFTPSSYESADPYHGGAGYRPTINAYQYGDARAIAAIAGLAGDPSISTEYANRADALRLSTQKYLWDSGSEFFHDMPRDVNPDHTLTSTRELDGFVPWMFDMPQASDSAAFAELLDPNGFFAPYGPTTTERRSKWFMYQASGCCHWDGPSWPYETSQALTGLANLLDDYPAQSTITASNYADLLHRYAATQYRDGVPYVAEAHDPDQDRWIYDGHDHSEDYNHSTYVDNVISGLIGLRGQADDTLIVKPLAPSTWDYFAIENAPYHGHNVSVFWDVDGKRYHVGAGLTAFVDGVLAGHRATIGALTVKVGPAVTQPSAGDEPLAPSIARGFVDAAANGQRFDYGPQAFASFTSQYDNPWNAIDGIVYRTSIPENSRWTSYSTKNATDYYGVEFQRNVTVDEVRLYFYDDGGGVRTPGSYDLQYWNGHDWVDIPGQKRAPSTPSANALNRIIFPALAVRKLRVVAPNAGGGTGWGLSEFEAMSRPIFAIVNVNSDKVLTASTSALVQRSDDGSGDCRWELVDAGAGWFKLRNVSTGRLLSVDSTADSAPIGVAADGVGDDRLWRFVDTGGGKFQIANKKSSLLLGVDGMSKDDGAKVVQFHDNGTADHLWMMEVTGG